MIKPLKFTWEIYTGKFEKLLVIMLLTTLPLLIVHSLVTNYVYAITPNLIGVYSVADIYYGFLTLLLYLFAQIPYISFVLAEYEGNEHSLKHALYIFIINGFTIFLFSCIVSLISTIGFMLFVVPGLILLSLVFPIPYISIFDEKSVWKSFKEGFRLGKKHFFKLLLIVFISGMAELIFGIFVTAQLFNITSSYAAQIITQIVLNLLFYPFIIILLTSYMIKWREKQEVLEVNVEEA
ncbi:hypothetical protein ACFO3D_10565 [Virgibacillus kekensis]|uniref:Glycerophosphoryl diester phosphodiesterase membrane domain-containing protein n=1 Tax=Virgibacillus kekensis TaxID=202261 RepID=A0ABV9DKG2_9BACI